MSNQKVNHQLKARVYRSTGSWYIIKNAAGAFLQARFKGKFKIDAAIKSSNPIAVGDWVIYEELPDEEGIVTITDIEKRNNYIVRVSPQNRHHKHIISANLDAAIVIATIDSPKTSMGFIDRFLITAAAYHIPAILIINKIDLLKDKHQHTLASWIKTYTDAGYPVIPMHVEDAEKIKELNAACGIPASLKEVGVKEEDIPQLVSEALKIQRLLKNNPREINEQGATAIFKSAF